MTTIIICFAFCVLAAVFGDAFGSAIVFLVKSIAFMIQSAAWVISLVILVGLLGYGIAWLLT